MFTAFVVCVVFVFVYICMCGLYLVLVLKCIIIKSEFKNHSIGALFFKKIKMCLFTVIGLIIIFFIDHHQYMPTYYINLKLFIRPVIANLIARVIGR